MTYKKSDELWSFKITMNIATFGKCASRMNDRPPGQGRVTLTITDLYKASVADDQKPAFRSCRRFFALTLQTIRRFRSRDWRTSESIRFCHRLSSRGEPS